MANWNNLTADVLEEIAYTLAFSGNCIDLASVHTFSLVSREAAAAVARSAEQIIYQAQKTFEMDCPHYDGIVTIHSCGKRTVTVNMGMWLHSATLFSGQTKLAKVTWSAPGDDPSLDVHVEICGLGSSPAEYEHCKKTLLALPDPECDPLDFRWFTWRPAGSQ